MLIFIYLLIAAGLVMIALSFQKEEKHASLPAEFRREAEVNNLNLESKKKRPVPFASLLTPLNQRILSPKSRKNLISKLWGADMNLSPEEYLGVKEILAVIFVVVALFVIEVKEPLYLVFAGLIGFLVPDFFLKSRTAQRKREVIRALPEAIDLLVLCVEGGLDFMIGLRWVVERSPKNALINEFSFVLHEVKIGRTRERALKDMANRLGISEVTSFINALTHAEKMGTPILEVLDILSDEARRQRFQKGERKALQAPVKMLLPLIVFILPVVAIIVAGPILIQFLQGGITSQF